MKNTAHILFLKRIYLFDSTSRGSSRWRRGRSRRPTEQTVGYGARSFFFFSTVQNLFGILVGMTDSWLHCLFTLYGNIYYILTYIVHKIRSFRRVMYNTCNIEFVHWIPVKKKRWTRHVVCWVKE